MGLGLYRFAHTLADPDIWGHIAIGRLYHETGRIRQPDPFSYVTAGHEWLNFEWLFEVVLFRVFAAAGPAGLIVLKVAVGLLLLGIVYRLLCRQGLPPLRAGIVVVAVIHFLVPFFLTVRPQFVTYGFFLVVLLLLRAMDRGDARWLYAAPPLFALWANLHPGFLAGLGVLGIWTVVEFGRRWLQRGAPRRRRARRCGRSSRSWLPVCWPPGSIPGDSVSSHSSGAPRRCRDPRSASGSRCFSSAVEASPTCS